MNKKKGKNTKKAKNTKYLLSYSDGVSTTGCIDFDRINQAFYWPRKEDEKKTGKKAMKAKKTT